MYHWIKDLLPLTVASLHDLITDQLLLLHLTLRTQELLFRNQTGTADTSEHESNPQSGEAEPIPGPSSGQPSCDPFIQASLQGSPLH